MERIKKLLESDKPIKWIFYGDSITHGALHTFGKRDYSEHFDERIRSEMGRKTDIILNTAISGDDTRRLLEGFDWRVRQFNPDVVFIMIGMNDCTDLRDISQEEFGDNLQRLCDLLQKINALPILQTTCPLLPNTAPDRRPYLPKYMQTIRDVAQKNQLPLIDHYHYWRAHPEKLYYWQSNAFHPNAHGHLAFAHFLFRELGIFDEKSNVCKLFVP